MSNGNDAKQPKAVPKYSQIFDAMNGHRAVLGRLSGLVDKIEGSGQCEVDKTTKDPKPTLLEFLDRGVEEMQIMTDILVTQTNKLEKMLF